MEMTRMEAAMRTLGGCVPKAPERLVRDMALTVRKLEQERLRMAGASDRRSVKDKSKEINRELQQKKPDTRKL